MTSPSRRPAEAALPRMARLAKLPLFFDLADRRAVVIGGGEAATWKAELLAAAGARVDVYAESACAFLAVLDPPAGTIRMIARKWAHEDLDGAAIAIAEKSEDVAAFRTAARTAGVPSAVIDLPAESDFQFGSIVNRSPVVIGISTDGAAPVLAQAIRRRIEMLLPPALVRWVEAAKRVRRRLAELAPDAAQRRAFWQRVAERAFVAPPDDDPDAEILSLLRASEEAGRRHGRVTLVGAGPGDAELLTVKAVRALQSADVILFDDLASEEVLDFARREAKRFMVGKRGGGRPSCRQEDINALMVRLACQGKHVVRLKSGDPMVFGRAGEEIALLEAAGIPVETVPGISAGIAAASAFGVSLTHRDTAHSVRFVTGHARNGQLPVDLDWAGLADRETTLVVYMGGRTSAEFATRLIHHGRPAETPVVAVASLSRPAERRWSGRLADMAGGLDEFAAGAPVTICIGDVFAAHCAAREMASTASRSA